MANLKLLNNEEVRIDLDKLQECDFCDVIINNELQLHIVRSDIGYIIDCYKHMEQDDMDDDHDFDGDYITSCTVWDDDLAEEEEI